MRCEVVFIGTGDAMCMAGRSNQALLLQTDKCTALFDCGPTTLYRFQNIGFGVNDLDAVFFTHFHGDHFAGIVFLDLALTLGGRRKKIVYGGPPGLETHFNLLYNLCYPGFYPNKKFIRQFVEYLPNETYTCKKMVLNPLRVKHRPESLGYRIKVANKTIALSGDSGWCEELIQLANGTDLFICECEHYEKNPHLTTHLSYKQLRHNEHLLATKRIVLVHPGAQVLEHKDDLVYELAKDDMHIVL